MLSYKGNIIHNEEMGEIYLDDPHSGELNILNLFYEHRGKQVTYPNIYITIEE